MSKHALSLSAQTTPAHSTPVDPASARAPLTRPRRRTALLGLALLPLAACSAAGSEGDSADSASDGGGDPAGGSGADGSDTSGTSPLTVVDPWVKAADDGMTSAFATITNTGETELVLVSVTTPASEVVELHQTAADGSGGMSMEEKEGGFPIPPGEDLLLEPGGDHIMLMDLAEPLLPGDEVELVLVLDDGTEHPVTATVKDFAGAQEEYGGVEDEHAGHGDHGDHDASDGGGEHAEHDDHAEHGEDE